MSPYRYLYLRTPESLRGYFPNRKIFAGGVTAVLTAAVLAGLQGLGVEVDAAVPFLNLVVEQELTYRQAVNTVAPLVAAYAVTEPQVQMLEGEPADEDGHTTLGTPLYNSFDRDLTADEITVENVTATPIVNIYNYDQIVKP